MNVPIRAQFTPSERRVIGFCLVASTLVSLTAMLVLTLVLRGERRKNSVLEFDTTQGFVVKSARPQGAKIDCSLLGIYEGHQGHQAVLNQFAFELNDILRKVPAGEKAAILAALTLFIRQNTGAKVVQFLRALLAQKRMPRAYAQFRVVGA